MVSQRGILYESRIRIWIVIIFESISFFLLFYSQKINL
jgi:hypothetical protein